LGPLTRRIGAVRRGQARPAPAPGKVVCRWCADAHLLAPARVALAAIPRKRRMSGPPRARMHSASPRTCAAWRAPRRPSRPRARPRLPCAVRQLARRRTRGRGRAAASRCTRPSRTRTRGGAHPPRAAGSRPPWLNSSESSFPAVEFGSARVGGESPTGITRARRPGRGYAPADGELFKLSRRAMFAL
jgi:hypothetical protein